MAQTLDALVIELKADIRGLQSSLRTASGDIQRFTGQAEQRTGALTGAIASARSAFLAFGGAWAGFRVGQQFFQAGVQMEGLRSKMLAATGSAEAAGQAMAYVRAESERLGLRFTDTADSFGSFAAAATRAGLTLKQVQDVFTGVSQASAAFRLSNERVNLVFQALAQMAAKGVVSMEELRQQLGESLPIAMDAAARAMGVTQAQFIKMVENGDVAAKDFLPRFGQAIRENLGDAVAQSSQSAQANLNRVNNSLDNLKSTVAEGGFMQALATSFKAVNEAVNTPALRDGLKVIGQVIGGVVIFVSQAVAGLAIMIQKLTELGAKAKDLLTTVPGGGKGTPAPRVNPDRPSAAGALQQTSFLPDMQLQSAQFGNSSGGQTFDGSKALTLEELFAKEQEYRDNTISAETDFWTARNALQEESLIANQSSLEAFLGIRLRTFDAMGQEEIGKQAQTFRTTLQQAAQHNKTFFMVEKAAAIARALISARESVVSAFNWGMRLGGPPLAAGFAAAAAAAQAVNIGAIASASFGGGGTTSGGGTVSTGTTGVNQPSDGLGRPMPAKQIYISLEGRDSSTFTKSQVRDLIAQLNDAFADGSKLQAVVVA